MAACATLNPETRPMKITIPYSQKGARCVIGVLSRHAVAVARTQTSAVIVLDPGHLSDEDLALCACVLHLIGARVEYDVLRAQWDARRRLVAVWRGSDHACN